MKKINLEPDNQVFWYLKREPTQQLKENIRTDVIVVGGGMAGITAAQSFYDKGLSVVLIEKNFCGAGASGKSSGFITQESELNLTHLINLFNESDAQKLWNFVSNGVDIIHENIKKFNLKCDYQYQDTLVVANSEKTFKRLKKEHENRIKLGFKSKLYDKNQLQKILSSKKYYGGQLAYDTFGISSYLYCQEMKSILLHYGVQIFEDTPCIKINEHSVDTPHASIHAKYIVICVDKFLPDLHKLPQYIYHAQTFLLVSEPLTESDIKKIFPDKNLLVWDTDLIYQYYRIIEGNRLLVGGSDLMSIMWGKEQHNQKRIINKLTKYINNKFNIKINFNYFWPGLIGISRDIIPIACTDLGFAQGLGGHGKQNQNIFYISGATGLPWAAALGNYSAQRILENNKEFDKYFKADRNYPLNNLFQFFFGKRITFGLSNLYTLYFND